ncbi:MAG: DUF262 domain-containing protein [Selenomonadaceae bacterium]|nr:DUF262 domain-containing protein [Selenomonadaceae bacterium]
MKKIDGTPKSLKQLLQNTKYTIHYYQREYRWQRKHIEELIDDLTSEFLENYQPHHQRDEVANYGSYFMGSIVLAGHENAIIDGQQRFSSLTLLLTYLNNRLRQLNKSYSMIEAMIFSEVYGKKSFNINVAERQACMTAIYENKLANFDVVNASESVKNLCARYNDIEEIFPPDITDDMLLYFCDWLVEKVFFIEIVASTEQDAHKIFVSMNDRGLSLTSTEMLKGYLLSEIKNDTLREKLNGVWKDEIFALKKFDDKGDEIFIKTWLRAQYAETIRQGRAGAVNEDFDIIGGPFHKWVRDNHANLKLNSSADYEQFLKNFSRFAKIYRQIRDAEDNFAAATKYVFYNAQLNFTLQPQVLLASVCPDDNDETVMQKINLAARFLDLWINTRITNGKSLDYSTVKNYIFNLTKDIRRLPVSDLKVVLKSHYAALNYDPVNALHKQLKLNKSTKKSIKNLLARITSFIEEQTKVTPNYVTYMEKQTKNPFEVEHIICDHFNWFKGTFADEDEFDRYRNSIGALLLLRKSINASLKDSLYDVKLDKYCSTDGNIYAASLGAQTYQNNPRLKKFIADNNLPFEPFDKFGKAEIQKRTDLVVQLVNLIWNAEEFNV